MDPQYTFDPERFYLGTLCKRGHNYQATGKSIRYKLGTCVECAKIGSRANANKPYRRSNRQKWKSNKRAELRKQGLTSRGLLPLRANGAIPRDGQALVLQKAIRNAGRLPSVTQLVMDEQQRYWNENPEARAQWRRKWNAELRRFRYLADPSFRAYHREKSKRRKAQMRGGHAIKVTAAQLRQRFAQFGNTCAYCGTGGDLHIEHVVPISRGGTHTLGNVLPACQRCNYSKRAQDVSAWYLSQPFFSQPRWRRIGRVLGWGSGSPAQLTLL